MLYYKRAFLVGVLLAFGASTTNQAVAAGFRLPNQNAFATARGNAFTATANNPSAIYYNPAGITQLDGQQLELGVYSINFAVDVDIDDGSFSNKDQAQFVPQAFFTSDVGSWNWGVGLYAPFGLSNEWSNITPFSSITTFSEIKYLSLSPVIAKELWSGVSVGGGITINQAEVELKQGIGLFPGDEFAYKGDDTSVGYVLSVLAKLGEKHRFGLSYRSKVDHDLSGNSQVSFIDGSSNSDLDISMPALATIGYAYQPNESWDFEVNIEWGEWSELDQILITNTSLGDVPTGLAWDDGYIYQLGATRYLDRSAISFGYDYNESVQTEIFYTPSVSDADRHWFNVGYTRFYEDKSWTLAYQFGTSNRTVQGSTPNLVTGETTDGSYDVRAHSISFSYDISF